MNAPDDVVVMDADPVESAETAPQPLQEQAGQDEAPRSQVTSHPQAIRALAHAARLEALEELHSSQSTRTATELAERCGLTPSAMSYHLRALEKYGFVERSPSEGDGRERRWRASGASLLVSSLNHSAAAKHAFVDVQLSTFRKKLVREIDRREAAASGAPMPLTAEAPAAEGPGAPAADASKTTAAQGPETTAAPRASSPTPPRRPPVLSTGMLFLDQEQFLELSEEMRALIDRYENLNPPHARTLEAQRAYFMVSILPESPSTTAL